VFSGLLGALVGLTVVLFVLATMIVSSSNLNKQPDAAAEKAIAQRIAPIGQVALSNTGGSNGGSMMDGVVPTANAAGADKGKSVYDMTCAACHAAGVAGAPKFGDKAAWKDRVAKGMPTLHDHALKGFQGKAGFMPPKGGNTGLPDADVKAAVDFMVQHSK